MNINSISNFSPNFKGLYVETEGMGPVAKEQAKSLERKLAYNYDVDILDDMGVDVVIIADPKSKDGDRAKILFADPDNRLYKIDGKDHIKTGKTYDVGFKESTYSDNYEGVVKVMNDIITGKIFKKTAKPTQSSNEMVRLIPLRNNNLEGESFKDYMVEIDENDCFDEDDIY